MIDPTALQQTATTPGASNKVAQALALEQSLDARVGQRLDALVSKVLTLTEAERAFLSAKPGTLSTSQAQGTTANLQLLVLSVNDKLVNTLSDLPVKPGQSLTLVIRANGQLAVVALPQAQVAAQAPTQPPQPHTHNTLQTPAALASANLLTAGTSMAHEAHDQRVAKPLQQPGSSAPKAPAGTRGQSGATSATGLSATQALAKAPPVATAKSELGAPLSPSSSANRGTSHNPITNGGVSNTATQQLQKAPTQSALTNPQAPQRSSSSALLLPSYTELRAQAAYTKGATMGSSDARTLNAAILPKVLAEALNQASGLNKPLAQRLASLLSMPARLPIHSPETGTAPVIKALRQMTQLIQSIQTTSDWRQSPEQSLKISLLNSGIHYERNLLTLSQTHSPEQLGHITQDLKYQLQTLIAQLDLASNTFRPPLNPEQKTLFDQLAQVLFKTATPSNSARALESAVQNWRSELNSALQQVQLQQYRTAAAGFNETSTSNQTFFTEFPVRLFHGLGNLFIQWELPPDEKKKHKKKKNPTKAARHWRVFMEFEAQSTLAIELNLTESSLCGEFWTESQSLQQEAQENLDSLKTRLENTGLTVTDLRCHQGSPPVNGTTIDSAPFKVTT